MSRQPTPRKWRRNSIPDIASNTEGLTGLLNEHKVNWRARPVSAQRVLFRCQRATPIERADFFCRMYRHRHGTLASKVSGACADSDRTISCMRVMAICRSVAGQTRRPHHRVNREMYELGFWHAGSAVLMEAKCHGSNWRMITKVSALDGRLPAGI